MWMNDSGYMKFRLCGWKPTYRMGVSRCDRGFGDISGWVGREPSPVKGSLMDHEAC